MPFLSKQTAVRLLARYPLHWALPPGGLRTCGALLYHAEHSPAKLAALARTRRIPTRRLSVALVAARAAFRVGQDELVEAALPELEQRYPDAAGPHLLRADFETYYGRYDAALRAAERARAARPTWPSATARAVKLAYRVREREPADQAAVEAVARFPRDSEVLWTAAKACDSPAQAARLREAWQSRSREPADLVAAVRPLALAAARAGEVETALSLFREAITLIATGRAGPERVPDDRLGGRGAWQAIVDLCEALDAAGVRFFFAAGTALGLVRQGRPLSADSDVDVGVFEADWDRDALLEVFRAHPRFDLDLHPQTQKVSLRHRGGSPVDVFRFYRDGDRMWHDGVFVRWHNSPFTIDRREIRGLRVPLPAEADRYLTENYGDWRVPRPEFDAFTDDAPNLEVTWPEYQRLHFVRRAYQRLGAGDPGGARRELELAGETALAEQAGRA